MSALEVWIKLGYIIVNVEIMSLAWQGLVV